MFQGLAERQIFSAELRRLAGFGKDAEQLTLYTGGTSQAEVNLR